MQSSGPGTVDQSGNEYDTDINSLSPNQIVVIKCSCLCIALTLPDLGGRVSTGFSSITFDKDNILEQNFGQANFN